jgi:hypothetical protein
VQPSRLSWRRAIVCCCSGVSQRCTSRRVCCR